MSALYFLTTRRLGFRHWRPEDRDLALALWGDPQVTRLIDARGRLSPEQTSARLQEELDRQRDHGIQYWPIFLLATGRHVGCCGLRPCESEAEALEIGFHIRSDCWRRGYAREAAAAVIGYAFNTLGTAALFAGHHPDNAVSRQLLVSLGFGYTHDAYYPPTGRHHPSYRLDNPGASRRS